MTKRLRREREETVLTRRLLTIGGAASALAAAGALYVTSRPPELPTLSGAEPISTRLSRIGPTPHHQQLTGTGADLLVISDTGCAHCREFVRTGLEPLIRFAGVNGLSATYLSVGYGRSGLISTIASACAQREGSRLTGPDLVRALFALTEAGVPDGIDPEGAIIPAASALGVTRAELTRCVPEEALQFRDRFEATRSLFELARTPTFFLSDPDDPSRVLKLEGFTSAGALTRRHERALRVG